MKYRLRCELEEGESDMICAYRWNCQLAGKQVEMQGECLVNLYADVMCLGPITCQQQQSDKSKSTCSVFELINDKFDILNQLEF
jgi:hypothetical protein